MNNMANNNEEQGIREVAKRIFRRQDPNAESTSLRLFVINPYKVAVVWDPNIRGVRQQEILFYLAGEPQLWNRLVVTLPATLEYLRTKTNLPVDQCIQVDQTASNPIGRSYLVTNETPAGSRLDTVLNHLSLEQRLDLAAKLGTMLGGLVSRGVECDEAGILVQMAAPVPGTSNSSYQLIPLPDVGNSDDLTAERANIAALRTHFATCQPDAAATWFKQCFTAQLDYHRVRNHVGSAFWISRFLAMAEELSSAGWLMGTRFTYVDQALLRPDCWFIDYHHQRDTLSITRCDISHQGVLAPAFIACRAPAWLWGEEADINLMQWQRSVRDQFHNAAGQKYTRYSSHRVYRLAAKLGLFAINGFGTGQRDRMEADPREADRMLQDWDSIKNDEALSPPKDADEYATESE